METDENKNNPRRIPGGRMSRWVEYQRDPCAAFRVYTLRIPECALANTPRRWLIKWRIGWWLLKLIWRAA